MCIVPTFVGSAVFFFLKTLNDVQNILSINYGSRLPPTSFFSSFFLSMKIKKFLPFLCDMISSICFEI